MTAKKRILFLLPQLKQGGAERVVLNLIKGIDRARFMPCIAWFHGKVIYPFSELKDIPLFPLNKRNGFDLKVMAAIYSIIRSENIKLVNPHHFMPLFYAFPACKWSKAKIVYTEHSIWEVAQITGLWRMMSQFLLRKTDGVVGVSPEIAKFLKKKYGLPERRVHAVSNGIDTHLFAPNNASNAFRKAIGLDEHDIAIGMTGNFRKVKNHALLIDAFSLVSSQSPEARLVLIGQGFPGDTENTEKDIHALIQNSGLEEKVMLLGYRDDVHRVLQCLDIFCLTSFREGLPLSLLEAMACGLPVVGTNVEGIRIVIDSGRNGFLVNPYDSAGLATTLMSLLSDKRLRERMGKEGRKDAVKYYSLTCFSGQYNQLFASLL